MSVDSWYEGFLEEGPIASIPQYDSTTGTFYVNGVAVTGLVSYPLPSDIEAAFPAASNTDLVAMATNIHETGNYGGSLWKSNGVVYIPLFAPVYTYAAALALCNANTAAYTGARFTLSDVNKSVHYFDGTNLVPVNGRCKLVESAVQVPFTVPAAAVGASPVASDSGGFVKLTFSAGHGLTTASALNANLVVAATANGWSIGQLAKITAITDGGNDVTTDVTWASISGNPTIVRVNEDLILKKIDIPILHANSGLDINFEVSGNPRVGNKSVYCRFNSTTTNAYESNGFTTNYGIVCRLGLRNRNSQTSQIATHGSTTSTGNGIQNAAIATSTVDTGSPTVVYLMGRFQTTENEIMYLEHYSVWKEG